MIIRLIALASLVPTLAFAKGGRSGQLYAATIFADSAAGNDSSNGLTPATPKKTLAAVMALSPSATSILGLKRGSYWREGLYGLPAGASVLAYGTGNAPVIDSADRDTTWTATTGRTNVWETSWTKDTSYSNDGGFTYVMLWDGDMPLPGAASVAACESTPGSFYHDSVANKVYYHAADNSAPASRAIYITKRPEGIYQYTAAGSSANGITIDGIRSRRSYAHYGVISNGISGTTKNCIADGGGIHHMVLASGTMQDLIFLETSPRHTEGTAPLAVYQPSGAGYNPVVTRLFVVGSAATKAIQGATLSHTSNDPSGSYDTMGFDQCYVSYGQGFNANSTGAYTVSNTFVENGTLGVSIGTGTPTVTRSLFRNCTGSPATGAVISDAGPVDTTSRTRTISNSIIYLGTGLTGTTYGVRLDTRQGSLTLTNCVIYANSPTSGAGVVARVNGAGTLALTINNCVIIVPSGGFPAISSQDTGLTYTGDHNVFARLEAGYENKIPFIWHGAGMEQITNWRTATSQDAHSVYLSASQFATFFTGNVGAGDFRINASNAVTDADGTIYTGQFPDATALSTAGVQQYWNWNTRAVVNTAPTAWPVPPQTLVAANSYVNNPATWNFYP